MEGITPTLLVVGCVELLMFPLLLYLVKRAIGRRLDHFDEKRELARYEQAESKEQMDRQREAERSMILAMARTMLLTNYERCIEKGYYTVEERSVYSLLYSCYARDGGNGVIDTIAERIRTLPTEPPKDEGDD